jgi:CubicO group peptidase (beta-lactamase class C family)
MAAASPLAGQAEIDAYVDQSMRRLHIPAVALAVVAGDKIVHVRGFGRAHAKGGAPDAQTPFFIGSLTKSITALAVMQLVEGGKLALDAPVQRYLPWFRVADPHASALITVRHLLHQTSGLPTSAGETPLANFDSDPGAAARQARALATCELNHAPGTVCAYCNMNYNLLGLVIEAASGTTYAEYVRRRIFLPLDMHHTYVDKTAAAQHGLALGHQLWFWWPRPAPDLPVPLGSLPSGQIISCVEDMAHYLIALLNGGRYGRAQILSPAGVDELRRGAVEFSQWGISLGHYAMGWFTDTGGGPEVAWHTGNVPDFSAYMALLPRQGRGIILLSNVGHHMMVPVCGELGAGLAALLAGTSSARPPAAMTRTLPWLMRALLLLPLLQIGGGLVAVRQLRRWRREPLRRPHDRGERALVLLLPWLFDLAIAANLVPVLGRRRGYLRLFLPDYCWTARVCGSAALAWGVVRSGLILRALHAPPESAPAQAGPAALNSPAYKEPNP